MKALSPEVLKARLSVVLAYARGRDVEEAMACWTSVEPVDADNAGMALLEAVTQVVGDDRAMALVLFASSSFHLELAEVVDGRR